MKMPFGGTPVFALLMVVGVALFAVSVIWAYRDGERRGKEGLLSALLVALAAWPLSILIWLIVRPALSDVHDGSAQ